VQTFGCRPSAIREKGALAFAAPQLVAHADFLSPCV